MDHRKDDQTLDLMRPYLKDAGRRPWDRMMRHELAAGLRALSDPVRASEELFKAAPEGMKPEVIECFGDFPQPTIPPFVFEWLHYPRDRDVPETTLRMIGTWSATSPRLLLELLGHLRNKPLDPTFDVGLMLLLFACQRTWTHGREILCDPRVVELRTRLRKHRDWNWIRESYEALHSIHLGNPCDQDG